MRSWFPLGMMSDMASVEHGGCLSYMSPAQRWVVSPNNDTLYGAGFADLTNESAVIQTPTDVPDGHYWTVQIVDVWTNVVHQLRVGVRNIWRQVLAGRPNLVGRKAERVH